MNQEKHCGCVIDKDCRLHKNTEAIIQELQNLLLIFQDAIDFETDYHPLSRGFKQGVMRSLKKRSKQC